MGRRTIDGSRVLITGASSGIGRAVALEMARVGARLLLTARREARLTAVTHAAAGLGARVVAVAGDITDAAVRAQLIDVARTQFGGLDVLVNNAGIGGLGGFARAAPDRLRRIMEVNFFAAAELTRAALPLLRASQHPAIVNVSSVLGHFAVPGKSEYCASKFALHGLSDALRMELAPLGIDVVLVSPSTTDTEFFDHAAGSSADRPQPRRTGSPPAIVARRIVRATCRGQREVILSAGGRLLVWCDRLLPGLTSRLIARFTPWRDRPG